MRDFIGTSLWISFLLGIAWGLANFWCLARITRIVVAGGRKWKLAGWVALKLFGLYALAGWLLIGLKIPATGWLAGFTLSLIGLAVAALPSIPLILRQTRLPLFVLFSFLFVRLAEASEAAGAGEPAHPPEIPNFITLITHGHHGPVTHFLHTWENSIFAFVIVGLVGGLIAWGARSLAMLPGRAQAAVEAVVEGLEELVCGVLGKKEGRRYLPF